jgi:hypothetical protein
MKGDETMAKLYFAAFMLILLGLLSLKARSWLKNLTNLKWKNFSMTWLRPAWKN